MPTRMVSRPVGESPMSRMSTFIVKSVGGKGPSTRPSVQHASQLHEKCPVPEARSHWLMPFSFGSSSCTSSGYIRLDGYRGKPISISILPPSELSTWSMFQMKYVKPCAVVHG